MSKTLKESEVRKLVKALLEDRDFTSEVVKVNPVVDPSAAVTNPDNADYKPDSKVEFQVAVKTMIDDLPDEKLPDIYASFKQALEVQEDEKGKKQMDKSNKKVEETIRLAIRKMLSEAELPPVKKIPYGVSGIARGPSTPAVKGLRKDLEKMQLDDPDETLRGDEPAKGRDRKNVMMGDVSGSSFKDIAKELGFAAESGAKQAVVKALEKAKFVGTMDPDELEILVLKSMSDYIDMLSNTGELSPADVKLLKDHPDIVRDLEGFREFLDKSIRTTRKVSASTEE